MQRLFSMFPPGPPGVALLILRISLGALLLGGVPVPLSAPDSAWALLAPSVLALGLCLGFVTPIAAALSIVFEFSARLTGIGPPHATHVCALLDAVALMLLGPGAYSLDAKLFGRQKIVLPLHDGSTDD